MPRPNLQELLSDLTGNVPAGGKERWSLSDIDRLLREVSLETGMEALPVKKPEVMEEAPAPEPELLPEEPSQEPPQELLEEPSQELLQEPSQELLEEPPQEPAEEKTVVFEPLPPESSLLTPEEIGPAPARDDGMRFDLFRTQDLQNKLEGAGIISVPESAPEHTPTPIGQIEQPGATHTIAPQIEKPGVMLRRVDMQVTTDLSPVPRVVPADELRRQTPPEAQLLDIPEGQQRLPGFEKQAEARALSEDELKRQLEKNKAQRTGQFTSLRGLAEKMEEHGETGAPSEEFSDAVVTAEKVDTRYEYTEPDQRDQRFRLLRHARSRNAVTALTLGVFAAAAITMQGVSLLTAAGSYSRGMLFTHAVLLLAGLLGLGNELLKGAKALLRRAPNADTALLAAGLVSAVQAVLLLLPGEELPASVPCAALFLFQGTLHAIARWMQARHRCDNFRFVAYTHADSLYAVRLVDSRPDRSGSKYQDISEGMTAIPVPVRFPGELIKESLRQSAVDQTCAWMLPLSLGLAALVGASAGAMANSVAAGFSAGAIALCLCMPASNLLTLMSLVRTQQKGQVNGIAILNTAAAEHTAQAEAFALDSADLYLHPKGRMHGWREYWQVRTDEVLLYAAAIAIAAGGPLQAVFEGVVEGDYAVLPDVLELSYEDRMGLTCWIHNQKVFFGNRKLLENHGITVALTEKEERAYEHDGRKIVYMAMEKRLTAFFVVSYAADPALKPYMKSLEKEDIQAKICSSDPCVTKENVCAAFDLRSGSAQLLRAAPSQALRALMRMPRETETAGIYHASNARAFLRALTASTALRSGIRRLRAFQLMGMLTSFLLLLIFALTKQMDAANNLIFIGYTLIWTAITYAAARS